MTRMMVKGFIPALLSALVLCALGGCREPFWGSGASNDAFPLLPGTRWTYDGMFEGRQDRHTLELRTVVVGGRVSFAFFEEGSPFGDRQLLMGNMFADELFRRDGDVLLVADERLRDEEHVLLRFPLASGDETSYVVGTRETRVIVAGRDRVTVPAGTFDCVRLTIRSEVPGADESVHHVWLAPGVGLVRWHRATGRVDELVRHVPAGM